MLASLALAASLAGAAPAAAPSGPPEPVVALTLSGVVNPFSARYLERGLKAAKEQDAVLLLRLDTPGGLESTMRDMVRALLGSPVPVIVYVTPPGGRAASAGMFLVAAGHVAAMAPGTNIGAAHPVSVGGEQKAGEKKDPVAQKMVEDVAALARSVGKERGRNAEWLDRAVRRSVSITAAEAVQNKVVDLVSPGVPELLAAADGRVVSLPSGPRRLRTAGAQPQELPMNAFERFFAAVTDPNIAYILLTLGMIALAAELYTPGLMVSGAAGVVCLLLAFAALGSLPINWAAAALIALGIILFIVELQSPGLGAFGLVGLAAFLLGSSMFYRPFGPVSPALPRVEVAQGLLIGLAAVLGTGVAAVSWAVWRLRRRPTPVGAQALVGAEGTAASEVSLKGVVEVRGERWSATAQRPIHRGERVRVVGVKGVYLVVDKEER